MRRLAAAVAACLVVAAAVVPVGAQEAEGGGAIHLVAQTIWREPGTPFAITVDVDQPDDPSGLEVAVLVYARIGTRSAFAQTVEGRTRSATAVYSFPLAELVPAPDGTVPLSVTPDLQRAGVYPVRVELRERGGGLVIDSFQTYLVNVAATVEGAPLHVALVVPFHAPPARRPDGTTVVDDDQAAALADLADALAAPSTPPFSLVPTPETIEALAADAVTAGTVTTLADALAGRQVLASPYVPTNLTAMLDADLPAEIAAELLTGIEVTRELLGVTPDPSVRAVDERLDEAAISTLVDEQVDRVVVPEELLEPISARFTPAQTFRLEGAGEAMRVGVADQALSAHFTVPSDEPVASAVTLLADLAVLYFDAPGGEGRGVIASPPRRWQPSVEFVSALLGGLAASPILSATTLDGFFSSVAPAQTRGRETERAFRADLPSPAPLPGGAIRAGRRRVDAYGSAVPPGNQTVHRADRTLLTSMSVDLRPRDRTAYLAGLADRLQTELAAITMPVSRTITLTAREGEVPITIASSLPYPVRGVLLLESENLQFPDGQRFEVELTRRNTTQRVAVLARSSGSFPLVARFEAPAGGLVLAESRLTVRSTALSGVGVGLSIGAGVFLVIWWGIHLRGRRRSS